MKRKISVRVDSHIWDYLVENKPDGETMSSFVNYCLARYIGTYAENHIMEYLVNEGIIEI